MKTPIDGLDAAKKDLRAYLVGFEKSLLNAWVTRFPEVDRKLVSAVVKKACGNLYSDCTFLEGSVEAAEVKFRAGLEHTGKLLGFAQVTWKKLLGDSKNDENIRTFLDLASHFPPTATVFLFGLLGRACPKEYSAIQRETDPLISAAKGFALGLKMGGVLRKAAWAKSKGRPDGPVDEIIRRMHREQRKRPANRRMPPKAICEEACQEFKGAFPDRKCPKVQSLISRFKRIVERK